MEMLDRSQVSGELSRTLELSELQPALGVHGQGEAG
jgi:hypothetical protein